MIKHSMFVLTLAGSLVFCSFASVEKGNAIQTVVLDSVPVVVKRIFPENAGKDFKVQLVIRKGNLSGFGKIQENLPEGFTATTDQTNQGSFSFSDQKVKIVWVNLPAEEEFTVSYNVHIGESQLTANNINGLFSYIENDETRKYIIPESSGGSGVAAVTPAPEKAAAPAENPPVIEEQKTVTATEPSNSGNQASPVETAKKVEETLPASNPVKTEEVPVVPPPPATAPVTENQAMTAPSTPEVKKEEPVEKPAENIPAVSAEETKKVSSEELARIVEEKKKEASHENKNLNSSIPESKPSSSEPVSSTAKQSGIIFKVQIAALQSPGKAGWLKNKYNIPGKIETEQSDGITRYLYGKFTAYDAAREFRDKIKANGAEGAFITAYSSGKRIPVQEAIRLSGQ
jgi:hypothetical protein